MVSTLLRFWLAYSQPMPTLIPALLWDRGIQRYKRYLSALQAMWQQCLFKNRSRSTNLRSVVFWLGFLDICGLLKLQLPIIYEHQTNEKSLWVPPNGKEDVILGFSPLGPLPRRGEIKFLLQELFMNFLNWLFLIKCRNSQSRTQILDPRCFSKANQSSWLYFLFLLGEIEEHLGFGTSTGAGGR